MPFLDRDTCVEGGGLFISARVSSLYDAIHGWMMRQMDGWKAAFRPRRPLLYVIVQERKETTINFQAKKRRKSSERNGSLQKASLPYSKTIT